MQVLEPYSKKFWFVQSGIGPGNLHLNKHLQWLWHIDGVKTSQKWALEVKISNASMQASRCQPSGNSLGFVMKKKKGGIDKSWVLAFLSVWFLSFHILPSWLSRNLLSLPFGTLREHPQISLAFCRVMSYRDKLWNTPSWSYCGDMWHGAWNQSHRHGWKELSASLGETEEEGQAPKGEARGRGRVRSCSLPVTNCATTLACSYSKYAAYGISEWKESGWAGTPGRLLPDAM